MQEGYNDIFQLLSVSHGIDISKYDNSFLRKSLANRCSCTGINSLQEYYIFLKTNPDEAVLLCKSMQNSFSEFFRNPLTFSYLEQVILPLLIENKKISAEKEIRVWSAACASGQEACSIAILLDEISETSMQGVPYRIFGTDIIDQELSYAKKGIYSDSSLNKVTFKRFRKYFSKVGDRYKISPKLLSGIDYSFFDLLSEQNCCPPASIFGNFDIIFCSNLLFYYKDNYRKKILEKIGQCLSPGGYLITGESEREIAKQHNYRETLMNTCVFKK